MYKMNLLLFQSHYLQYASPIHGDEAEYELANAENNNALRVRREPTRTHNRMNA